MLSHHEFDNKMMLLFAAVITYDWLLTLPNEIHMFHRMEEDAPDVGTPVQAPQVDQQRRSQLTSAHPQDLIIGNPSQGIKT